MKVMQETLVGESGELLQESFDATSTLSESIKENFDILEDQGFYTVPEDFLHKVADIGDESPMFVTCAMYSGFSRRGEPEDVGHDNDPKHPHRFWHENIIFDFAEQIRVRRIPGFAGHEGFLSGGEIPENIPIMWVTAIKARRKEDGRGLNLVRGYVTKHGNTREQIKLGLIDSASISAVGNQKIKEREEDKVKYVEVQPGAKILSFDLVRKDQHGVPGTKLVASISNVEETMESKFEELEKKLTELALKNTELQKFQDMVESLVKKLGCTPETLVERVTNICAMHETVIKSAIEEATKGIQNATFRERVKNELLSKKFVEVSEVKVAADASISEMMSLVKDITGGKDLEVTLSSEGVEKSDIPDKYIKRGTK
ncbi:MAG: hypothetical protein WC998_00580 [Candidatus Paceibacterota bacterium]|jgi:hypothetical protein